MPTITFSAPLPDAQPVPFGKYFLVRKLAEGGMAEIFLAKHVGAEGFERNVVIKRMLANLSAHPDFVDMFLDEARLAARLSHPNIVQIHDLGKADGCYFICMEYLAGEDFSTALRTASKKREYVPMGIVLRVIIEAAQGLNFAHEFTDEAGRPLNIVHRDISPSNLYVTYQGQVKVLDFGIAKAESRVTHTSAGVVKGKYMYMAPEQARSQQVDRRADVFSLGVSLYEALTNTRPFARDVDLAILNAVLEGDFRPPRDLRPDIPPELEAVVLKAMAGPVEQRYQTAAEMAADLERILAAAPVNAAQVGGYLRELFGEERVAAKTRIPTLVTLTQNAAAAQPAAPAGPVAVAPPDGTAVVAPPAEAPRPPSRVARWVGGAALGALVLGGAGFALLQLRRPPPPPAPVAQASAPGVVAPPAPQAAPAPDPKPAPQPATPVGDPPSDAGTMLSGEPREEAPPPAPPEEPPAEPAAQAAVKHSAARPIVLDAEVIQKVVNRGRGPILGCFEQFKQDLPGDQGQVSVSFTILGSGKVTQAKVLGGLEGTKVGGCLEQRVKRLRFPAHKDKEVGLTMPFQYRIQR